MEWALSILCSFQTLDDFDAVLARATGAHVSRIMVTGTSLHDSQDALDLSMTRGRLSSLEGLSINSKC
jgi:Tat protein secretion system quality control protein TatD with DNase activity